ncbi:hypothetical protein LCGC14_1093390 [marine sediment metagenome]|uniref:Uncharacterized protein n=1 Tax=marine sediment metagenome TaxID=412755 RepID=A0A0F9MG38_9ZZZZ
MNITKYNTEQRKERFRNLILGLLRTKKYKENNITYEIVNKGLKKLSILESHALWDLVLVLYANKKEN